MRNKGITLISLVVTIVVILILAGVTISTVFSEEGIIAKAREAANRIDERIAQDQEELNRLYNDLDSAMNNTTSEEPVEPGKSEVEQAIDDKTKYTDTTPITDDLDNTVYIPGGFHLATDSGTKVEDGIVIEDDDGNQFVWIPTGTYKTTDGSKTNELTRRQWATTANNVQEPTSINGDEVATGNNGAYYYGEGDSRSVAYEQIAEFKSSAESVTNGGKGGFYIGRYEQGTGNVCKAGVDAYVNVTRNGAKTQAEAMYSSNSEIKAISELISSYAWDTALNFICQNNDAGYKLATTTDDTYGNIGTGNKTQTGGYTADCYSNIYDILGNCIEWTTEYSSDSFVPCVFRGGEFADSKSYAATRFYNWANSSGGNWSFRLQLYVN